VRGALGFAQMVGASAALILLLQSGPSAPTLVTVGITTSLRLLSYLMFRVPGLSN
jgi:hypothetical protein